VAAAIPDPESLDRMLRIAAARRFKTAEEVAAEFSTTPAEISKVEKKLEALRKDRVPGV
jgi:hypothetical protein